jgi:hypothetical protein
MTKDEALRLAWEALHQIAEVSATDYEYQQWASEAITAIKAALEAKDEPVACSMCNEWEKVCDQHLRYINKLKKKRTWVGLTDEEIVQMGLSNYVKVVRETEAKLKQKNEQQTQ